MNSKFEINFLCVGFQKCATTTLDGILRQHSGIALPDIKEIHMDEWYRRCDDPMKIIKQKFFAGNCEGKKIGIIDPNLCDYPRLIRRYMGSEIKLIFMMRNPVNRLFSYYKMALMLGLSEVYKSSMNGKEVRFVAKSFDRYIEEKFQDKNRSTSLLWGNYIDIILKFEHYFKRDMMKFIVFEEYLNTPEEHAREILDFLNLPYQRLDLGLWKGRGDRIPKNKLCFEVNSTIRQIREEARCNPKATLNHFRMADALVKKVNKWTQMENNERMSCDARRCLETYYGESVRRLEEYLDLDLSQVWF